MSGVIGFFLGAFIAGTVCTIVFGSLHLGAQEEAYKAGFEDGKRSVRNDK